MPVSSVLPVAGLRIVLTGSDNVITGRLPQAGSTGTILGYTFRDGRQTVEVEWSNGSRTVLDPVNDEFDFA